MPLLQTQSAKGFGFGISQAGYATGNFVSLQTLSGTGSSATLAFTDIPQTFKHLRIFAMHKGTATGANIQGMYTIQLNSDTGSNTNYLGTQIVGAGGGTNQIFAVKATGNNSIYGANDFYYNSLCSASTSGSAVAVSVIDIPDYTDTNHYKTVATFDGKEIGNNDGNSRVITGTGTGILNTNAITSITFKIYDEGLTATNFTSASRFELYGIAG